MSEMPTILHIEDNFENRLLVRRILQFEGYDVVEAESAREAMELLPECHPALILLDINMPEVDGYTLATRLKSIPEYKHIPMLAITANALRGDKERSFQAGCDGYIEKPIDMDVLIEMVAYYIEHAVKK
jgi:two-component system cell cycle response regulator DivK